MPGRNAAPTDAANGAADAAASRSAPAGSPDAGARIGHDVATPPAAAASAPKLNLELMRPPGSQYFRDGSRGALQLLPAPPERKSKLAEDIEKAAKPDCRKAYGSLGLLGAVPLAADAIRDDPKCRW